MTALNDLWRSWLQSQLGTGSGTAVTGPTSTHTADNTVTNASETILAANTARKGFIIENVSANNVRVNLAGATATTTNGLRLAENQVLTMLDPFCPKGAITAIREGASDAVLHVVEFT